MTDLLSCVKDENIQNYVMVHCQLSTSMRVGEMSAYNGQILILTNFPYLLIKLCIIQTLMSGNYYHIKLNQVTE